MQWLYVSIFNGQFPHLNVAISLLKIASLRIPRKIFLKRKSYLMCTVILEAYVSKKMAFFIKFLIRVSDLIAFTIFNSFYNIVIIIVTSVGIP